MFTLPSNASRHISHSRGNVNGSLLAEYQLVGAVPDVLTSVVYIYTTELYLIMHSYVLAAFLLYAQCYVHIRSLRNY